MNDQKGPWFLCSHGQAQEVSLATQDPDGQQGPEGEGSKAESRLQGLAKKEKPNSQAWWGCK